MALRVPTRQEIGQRVRWLRKQADLAGRDLAKLIKATDTGIMTKIERHGESFDYERLMELAIALAGRGQLRDDPDALFDFMLGRKDMHDVLVPTLRLVPPVDEALDSPPDDSAMGGYLTLADDLAA